MANNNLTIHTNRFFGSFLKSPIQLGWLSIINSVTSISCLGTFKWSLKVNYLNQDIWNYDLWRMFPNAEVNAESICNIH
jgi:hypothetical protein